MKKLFALWNCIGIWISGMTLIAMMLLTTMDVIGRYVFHHPISGTADLIEVMMVVIVFLALSDVASSGGHISVEILTLHLSQKKNLLLKTVMLTLSVLVSGVLAWQLGANAIYTFSHPEGTTVLYIPKAPFLVISSLGCGAVTLANLGVAIESALKYLSRKTSNDETV